MKILTVAASSNGTTNLPYTPQFIGLKLGAAGSISNVLVTREGDSVPMNLDQDGFLGLAQSERIEDLIKTDILFVPIADGYIKGPTNFSVTTGAGGAVELYVFSFRKGEILMQNQAQTIVADVATYFTDFGKIMFPSANLPATAIITVVMHDGTSQQMTVDEIKGIGSMSFNNDDEFIVFDNFDFHYKSVMIQPVANAKGYVQRWNDSSVLHARTNAIKRGRVLSEEIVSKEVKRYLNR